MVFSSRVSILLCPVIQAGGNVTHDDLEDDPDLAKVREQQTKVLLARRAAAIQGKGAPNPYIDAKGGEMKMDEPQDKARKKKTSAGLLPLRPSLKRSRSIEMERQKPPSKFLKPAVGQSADVFWVKDPTAETPEALEARLLGKRLVNEAWLKHHAESAPLPREAQCFDFEPVVQTMHLILHLTAGFLAEFPVHAKVLEECAAVAGTVNVQKKALPRLNVSRSPMPEKPQQPSCTYKVVGSREAESGLTLSDLFFKMTKLRK